MQKIILHLILIFLNIFLSSPKCQEGGNLCVKCNPITNLCVKCEKNIYTPDENGGCKKAETCIEGKNHCLECDSENKLCKICEGSYYPDENGSCSYSNNCEISYKGICLKCKQEFILIGKYDYYLDNNEIQICKALVSEDFKNCEKINIDKGIYQ